MRVIRVLLVEDDPEDILLTRDLLSGKEGIRFEIEVAGTLQAGLELLERSHIDVVLLDLTLPDSHGIETFMRLRSRAPEAPVVLLTGMADDDLAVMAVQEGAQDYLAKHKVDREQAVRAIRYAIERQRSESALKRYRDHLEDLVTARTAELRRANEQLQQEVNERRKAVDEKDRLQAELLEGMKLEAVGRLAAGVAHEFNNALTVVTGYGELLRDRLSPEDPARQDVEQIVKAGERAAALTRQLLAFGRKQAIRPKSIDANLLINASKSLVEPYLSEDIRVVTLPAGEPVYIKCDESQMERILINLAVNAKDAMPQGGTFTLRAENVIVDDAPPGIEPRTGRFVCLSVEDTGVGMDGETLEHLFEPFFSTKREGQRLGLGLAVVYGVVKQHGGWIEATSHLGSGSVFRIYLPAAAHSAEALPGEVSVKEDAPQEGSGELILLIEDEDSVREFLNRALQKHGYAVEAVATAQEAVERFPAVMERCRLILTDVVLPDRNGVDLADALLAVKPEIKVLVSSGYSDGRSHRHHIEEKGYRFLPKPYSMSELLRTVRAAMNGG